MPMFGLETFFAKYGFWAIFLGAGIEGETATVIGGVIVHRGLVSLPLAVLAAGLGSFLADQSLFWIGRRFRNHERMKKFMATSAYNRVIGTIERNPNLFIFGFRFIYGIRTASPIVLGSSTISAPRFLVVNFISAFVWAACFIGLGFVFGSTIEAVLGKVQRLELLIVAIPIVSALVWLLRRVKHRPASRNEDTRI